MNNSNKFPSCANLLTSEEIEKIHEASLEILERVGLGVFNAKAFEIFAKHNCIADSKTQNVKIPRKVIEEFMAYVPSKFTFHGRDPQFDRTIPDDGPIFSAGGTAPNVVDLETGAIRPSTSEDIARMSHLANEMPGMDISMCAVLPNDADPENQNLARLYPALKNTLKPVRSGGVHTVEEAEKIVRLGALIAGSEEAFFERPFITFHNCPLISPLKMDDVSTEMLIYFTERKIPTYFSILPNAGLTSPMSLVGTLAQLNAEFLATTVLVQMVRKETPVIYSTIPTVADLRTGAYAPGAIETGILFMGAAQMARYYNVPCGGSVGKTNSKLPDAQAGFERGLSPMGGLLAGMDLLHIGGLVNALMDFDYRMYVIDSEIAQMLKRVKRGYEFSEDELKCSVDAIEEVGPGGDYLKSMHTFERMRKVPFIPEIAERAPRSQWEEEGSLDASARALKKVQDILSRDNPAVFSAEIEARIRAEFKGLVAGDSTAPASWKK